MLAPVVGALVAILVTGKISATLAHRALARTLRGRLGRSLLIGEAREQTPWWYASDKDLDHVGLRLVALGDESVAIDGPAAEAIWHAAQMIPVLQRCRGMYDAVVSDIAKQIEKLDLERDHATRQRVHQTISAAIERRDDALDALSHIYSDLLTADRRLARVGHWLRWVDRLPETSPPSPLQSALDYAERHLEGAARWQEPSFDDLEILRIRSVAIQIPPPSGDEEIDQRLPRRHLLGDDDILDRLPGRGSGTDRSSKSRISHG